MTQIIVLSLESYWIIFLTYDGKQTDHTGEIVISRKPFRIGHMYIYIILLRMTDTVTSQNIELSSWDTLYSVGWKIME
jgi:hypothetical protein